jgi:hypothetical protein
MPVLIFVIIGQRCAQRPSHLLVILNQICKQVGCANIQGMVCWRRYRLRNRSYDGFVIFEDIVQHLMRRRKATWVFTKSASLKILSHGAGRMRSQSSDAFCHLIYANREDAVLFLEKRVKLPKMRAGNVPMAIPQLNQEYVFI